MKFNSIEELFEYSKITHPEHGKEFNVKLIISSDGSVDLHPDSKNVEEIEVIPQKIEESVGILSFSESPNVIAGLLDNINENVLYADEFESVPFSCSTGRVVTMGRTIFTNICENDDTGPVIYLNIKLNETVHTNVPFKLKKTPTNETGYIMLLNPKSLEKHD